MKRIAFFLSIALSSSLIFLIAETWQVYSCGGFDDYEKYRISYVDPTLLSDSLYRSFYGTLMRPHQDVENWGRSEFTGWTYDEGATNDDNLAAWDRYFDGRISPRPLRDLIYRSSEESLALLRKKISSGDPTPILDSITPAPNEWVGPDTIYRQNAWEVIRDRGDIAFLDYFDYALRAAEHAWEVDLNEWDGARKKKDTVAMKRLIEEGVAGYRAAGSDELKLRYGFQLVRLARYLGRYDQVETYYRTMFSAAPPLHPIRLQALGHLAGARLRSGDRVGGNELFAHLFDSSSTQRLTALRDVRLRTPEDWGALYGRAKTPEQKTNLWLIRGLKQNRLTFDYLKEIYHLTPRSSKLELALFRELHRIESYLYDDRVTREIEIAESGRVDDYVYDPEKETTTTVSTNVYYRNREDLARHLSPGKGWDSLFYYLVDREAEDPKDRTTLDTIISGREYISNFRTFVLDVARSDEVDQPALWYMVAGYIDIMDGDYHVADECLEEARDAVGGNYDLKQQINLLEYLRRRMDGKDPNRSTQEIAEALAWMERKQRANNHSKFDRTMAETGRRYLMEDDVARGILAFDRAGDKVTRNNLLDLYASDEDLQDLSKLVKMGGENEIDRLMLDSFSYRVDHISDIRATRMMRAGEYRKAQELYNSIGTAYWGPTGDPGETACFRFTTNRVIVDTNLPKGIPQGDESTEMRVTRRDFANELVDVLDRIDRAEGGAKTRELVAAGDLLYNAPYWGYNGVVWDGSLLWMRVFTPSAYPFNNQKLAERMESGSNAFMAVYGSRRTARGFYQRAVRHNADRELAARAAYMIDLCDKQPAASLHEKPTIKEQSRDGYNLLMQKYRDTETGKRILSQCSVYRYF